MEQSNSSLARYVATDVSSARVARIWEGVSTRLSQERPRRSAWWPRAAAIGAVVVCAGVGVYFLEGREMNPSAWQNAALSTAGDALAVDLEDGSHLELGAHTRVEVAERSANAVELRLNQGRIACDVVPNTARRFVVSSAGVEVRVTGTRFTVELAADAAHVSVEVQRGAVEVRGPDGGAPRRLAAGEHLSVAVNRADAPPDAPAPAESVEARALERVAAAPRTRAPVTSRPEPPPESDDGAPVPSLENSSARELLEQANSARRAGDVAHAVAGYELLLAKYPSDGRAALAAFELGRLRMDRLGNLPGAVNALRQAMALSKDAGFREDAMARLVRAYDGMGATERCREAQSAYLRSYPSGVHTASVSGRCGGRKSAPEPR